MKQLLTQASNEIISLRRRIEILNAQMAIVDVFAACSGLKRDEQRTMTIDIVWELKQKIIELEKQAPIPNRDSIAHEMFERDYHRLEHGQKEIVDQRFADLLIVRMGKQGTTTNIPIEGERL